MSTRTRESATDRIFDGIIERQATLFDVIRGNSERIHRFNHSLIEGARQDGRDWAEVGRRWAARPTDIMGFYESVSEAIGNSQARSLALAREWVEDALQSQRETSDAFRRGFGDAREVLQEVQERAPQILRRGANGGRAGRDGGGKAEKAAS